MTEVTVNSRICGFTHKIKGKMEGDKVIVDIDTPCEKVKEFSHLEVPMMDLFDIKDNCVMQNAKEADCTSICLVPCGVMHVCRIEAGLLSKTLVQNVGSVDISFE